MRRRTVLTAWLLGSLATVPAAAQEAGEQAAPASSVAENTQVVENTPRLCQNGEDDDGDGQVDCADDGCRRLIFCVGYRPPEEGHELCTNGEDDDGDRLVDCRDDGCAEVCGVVAGATEDVAGRPGTNGIYAPREVERGPEVGYLEHESERDYPATWAARSMTYLSGMLVPQLGLSVRDLNPTGDVYAQLGAGAAYGVTDFLQVHIAPLQLKLAPASPEYEGPGLGLLLRLFSEEVVEVGLYTHVVLPFATAEGLFGGLPFVEPLPTGSVTALARLTQTTQLDAALLLRLRFAELVRVELTLPLASILFSDSPSGIDPRANLVFDLRVGVSILEHAYVGAYSGAILIGNAFDSALVPFGFFAGAVIPGPSRRGPLADVGVRFGWPGFGRPGPAGAGDVFTDQWQLTLDARVFTYLLP